MSRIRDHTKNSQAQHSKSNQSYRTHEPERIEIHQNIGETTIFIVLKVFVNKYRIILKFCCGDDDIPETITEKVGRR